MATHRNPRTGRYDDELGTALHAGTATVGDVLAHAQEIIVEAPEVWGTVVTEPVRLLLLIIQELGAGKPLISSDPIAEIDV